MSKCHHHFKRLFFYFTDHIVDLANGKEDTETEQSTTNLHYTPEEVVKSKPQSRTRSADMENALSRHPLPEPDAGQDSDLKVSITDRENITVKSKDGFVSYKISTEVLYMCISEGEGNG